MFRLSLKPYFTETKRDFYMPAPDSPERDNKFNWSGSS